MILLISTCKDNLSENEFLKPISDIIVGMGIKTETARYNEKIGYSRYSKIIICGTALKDFDYQDYLGNFYWIRDYEDQVIGICSGAQIIAEAFGCTLQDDKRIGPKEVHVETDNDKIIPSGKYEAYFLHSRSPMLNNEFLCLTKDNSVFRHKTRSIYGVMFHPEVLNPEIIRRFLQ